MHFSYSCNGRVAACEKERFGGCDYCWRVDLSKRLSALVFGCVVLTSSEYSGSALIDLDDLESLVSKAEAAISLLAMLNRILDETSQHESGSGWVIQDKLFIEAGAVAFKAAGEGRPVPSQQ